MKLIVCKDCGTSISSNAKACPACGNPVKKETSTFGKVVLTIGLGVLFLGFAGAFMGDGPSRSLPSEPKFEDAPFAEYFNSWDGSHTDFTKVIKASMHDPESYDHVKTVFLEKEDHLHVITKFRGKNGFGGLVLNTVSAEVSKVDGRVLRTDQ